MSKNDEFCIENEELCIKNETLCIKNKEFCIKKDEFCRPTRKATSTANCNIIANCFFSNFSIENAERMDNCPWKMMILN